MGSVFLRGNTWVGEYKDRGRIKREALGKKDVITKTMARAQLLEIERSIKRGQYGETPSLKDFSMD